MLSWRSTRFGSGKMPTPQVGTCCLCTAYLFIFTNAPVTNILDCLLFSKCFCLARWIVRQIFASSLSAQCNLAHQTPCPAIKICTRQRARKERQSSKIPASRSRGYSDILWHVSTMKLSFFQSRDDLVFFSHNSSDAYHVQCHEEALNGKER